ncbi:MAG: hypothetical protein WC521_08085 [Bdellovibrionales bacterium]
MGTSHKTNNRIEYTVDQAIVVLEKYLASVSQEAPESANAAESKDVPSFNDCMEAMGALNRLVAEDAKKAQTTIIAVARNAKHAHVRKAALNRLKKMLEAEMQLEPQERVLACPDLFSAMSFITKDNDRENYKDPEGRATPAVSLEIAPTQELAREVI